MLREVVDYGGLMRGPHIEYLPRYLCYPVAFSLAPRIPLAVRSRPET